MWEPWYSPSSDGMSGGLGDQEGEESVKPHYTYIPGGLYTLRLANLTLATASSLDGDKKREGRGERERMVKDELMAKVKETEWWDSVSPYRRSEIDPGVLELSKPDS